jgi:RES domain-containing protein
VTLTAWRIYKPKHAATAFTGEGARLYGGRFNSKGVAVVYTAQSISLACLEMLVHLQADDLLRHYCLRSVRFDSRLVKSLEVASLPSNWREAPAPPEIQLLGDEWVASGESAVLRIPSTIVSEEVNFILNPAHPDFAKLVIGPERPHTFDPRLVKTTRRRRGRSGSSS